MYCKKGAIMQRLTRISNITLASGCCALRYILKHVVWRPLMGGFHLFIGAQHAVMPVTQAACGISTILTALALQAGYSCIASASWYAALRCIPIPTALASAYIWCIQTQSRTTRVIFALLLAVTGWAFFAIYAPDISVMAYTFYWILPIICAAYAHQNTFIMMLGATFAAHIAGSCIWLVTTAMTPANWIALIPVVAIERLTCASFMSATHYLYQYTAHGINTLSIYIMRMRKQIYARI